LSVTDQIQHAISAAHESYSCFQQMSASTELSINNLEAVAKARYVCSVLLEQIRNEKFNDKFEEIMQIMFTDTAINRITLAEEKTAEGPNVYFLKLAIRQVGFPFLKSIASESHTWIIPDLFKNNEVR